MTTIVKADAKGRLSIRGTEKGHEYLIKSENGGWWVMPAPKIQPPKKLREWAGPKKDLSEHLAEMGKLGLRIEPSEQSKELVGPCQF